MIIHSFLKYFHICFFKSSYARPTAFQEVIYILPFTVQLPANSSLYSSALTPSSFTQTLYCSTKTAPRSHWASFSVLIFFTYSAKLASLLKTLLQFPVILLYLSLTHALNYFLPWQKYSFIQTFNKYVLSTYYMIATKSMLSCSLYSGWLFQGFHPSPTSISKTTWTEVGVVLSEVQSIHICLECKPL